jgi:hypothetical protein
MCSANQGGIFAVQSASLALKMNGNAVCGFFE